MKSNHLPRCQPTMPALRRRCQLGWSTWPMPSWLTWPRSSLGKWSQWMICMPQWWRRRRRSPRRSTRTWSPNGRRRHRQPQWRGHSTLSSKPWSRGTRPRERPPRRADRQCPHQSGETSHQVPEERDPTLRPEVWGGAVPGSPCLCCRIQNWTCMRWQTWCPCMLDEDDWRRAPSHHRCCHILPARRKQLCKRCQASHHRARRKA